jgi:dynein heavy chain
MSDTTKLMFENEHLDHASPATVSRAGIVYVSSVNLGWYPVVSAWISRQPFEWRNALHSLVQRYIGVPTAPESGGHLFDFLHSVCVGSGDVMRMPRIGCISGFLRLLSALLRECAPQLAAAADPAFELQVEKLVAYSVSWAIGGVLESADRVRWDEYLRRNASVGALPAVRHKGDTLFDFYVDPRKLVWLRWTRPEWKLPVTRCATLSTAAVVAQHCVCVAIALCVSRCARRECLTRVCACAWMSDRHKLQFQDILVPTVGSCKAMAVIGHALDAGSPVLVTGSQGTAKTSTVLMYLDRCDASKRLVKRCNFSNATSPEMFQASMDMDLEKRGGKSYGPAGGKEMIVFIDDVSMPDINKWGDQPTNELLRQLIEQRGYYFLGKDKRGDLKVLRCAVPMYAMLFASGDDAMAMAMMIHWVWC